VAVITLVRSSARLDERFETVAQLADRIHVLRRGAGIQIDHATIYRPALPTGRCLLIVTDLGDFLGYAFADRDVLVTALASAQAESTAEPT
jgi:hypothetical protein